MKINKLICVFLIITSLFSIGCKQQNEQSKLRDEITEKEEALFSVKTEAIDNEKAIEMERLYVSYADKYSDDTICAEYLFRAAEIAENANHSNNAIAYLSRIEENYKSYKNYPLAIFKKAFVYENYLKNTEKAREYYEKFIADYPNHEFTETAKSSLMFLGVSDEELIKIIEQISKE